MVVRKGLLGKVILEQGSERNERVSHGAVWKKSFLPAQSWRPEHAESE